MAFYGQKYKTVLVVISITFLCVDLFLMRLYGFVGQALIALYVFLGIVPVCALAFVIGNVVPSVTLDDRCKTIVTRGIFDERRRYTKSQIATFSTIHLEEVQRCEISGNSIVLSMKWNSKKTLYLSAFSDRQIKSIQRQISSRLT